MITYIIVLAIVGIALYLTRQWIPPIIRTLIIILLVLSFILFLFDAFGIYPLPRAFRLVGK